MLMLVAACLPLASCKEIVYEERPLFDEPEATALGFLGYADEQSGLTVCGQCHVSFQRRWHDTRHAQAWETLATSPANAPLCQACHSTNSLGNVAAGTTGGYVAHADARYEDVQCESCHGPGLEHVQSPTRNTWPLASIAVGPTLESGCGECHSGTHQPFVEQWASSGHATVQASRATNPDCIGCHRAQDVLRVWGVKSEYREKSSATEHLPVTCPVCHDPHDATNPKQLRAPIDVANEDENLCMKCHHKRGGPDTLTFRGPHSPQGPLLLGTAGWRPPNMQQAPGTIVATHGSAANPRLCAGCHVNQWEVRDALTGQFVFRSTGHTFQAIPCVDAEGIPTTAQDCGETNLAQRSFRACAVSGCHGSEAVARSLVVLVRDRLSTLAAGVDELLEQVQPSWKTCRNNDRCPAGSEFNSKDGRYTTAEGSAFNFDLATASAGSAIHNPWLVEALLRASIRQIELDYALTAPAGLSLEQQLGPR
jgi:predicted CXXCH cytochrome family protein